MKKFILTLAAMAFMEIISAQSTDITKESNNAANQAKSGNVTGAANTASKTWQNNDISKSSAPGLRDAVKKEIEKAEKESADKPKETSTSSNTTTKTTK